jgi:hypothetical protein
MLNIKQLQRDVEDRQRKVLNNYDSILQQCYNKIMTTNQKITDCYCFFSCPTFVFGVPLYNMNSCIAYIMEKLIAKGFEVKYTNPNLIYISWKNGLNPPVYQNADPNELNSLSGAYMYSAYNQSKPMPQMLEYSPTSYLNMGSMGNYGSDMMENSGSIMGSGGSITYSGGRKNVSSSSSSGDTTKYRPINDVYVDGTLFN